MTTLTLGDFTFARYEIPEHIPFGAEQKIVTHELVGGKRVVDAMGRAPKHPAWSGWFVGENGLARARYLKGLCEDGKPLPLAWSELAYTVLIRSVECDFRLPWRIPYSITCEVITDDTAPIGAAPAPSLEQLTGDDMAGASGLAATLGIPALTSAVSGVESAIQAVNNVTTATLSQIRTVLQPIATARAVVGTLMREAGTTLANVGTLTSLGGVAPNDISNFANRLSVSSANSGSVGILSRIDAHLGRLHANLSSAKAGTASVTTGGGNLYSVAAARYGDAMAWTGIAQANGLSDPMLSGVSTITLPAAGPTTGGVLNG